MAESTSNQDRGPAAPDPAVGAGTAYQSVGSTFTRDQRHAPTLGSLTLAWATSSLLAIGFLLWLGFSWSGYSKRYAQSGGGWQLGGTQLVEITLVREDAQKLACASEEDVSGLRCAYRAGGKALSVSSTDPNAVLRPYSTVKGELLLGAGLWNSPDLRHALPPSRFTVVCQFEMRGVVKTASVRWALEGTFDPLKESVPMGLLHDCRIPS